MRGRIRETSGRVSAPTLLSSVASDRGIIDSAAGAPCRCQDQSNCCRRIAMCHGARCSHDVIRVAVGFHATSAGLPRTGISERDFSTTDAPTHAVTSRNRDYKSESRVERKIILRGIHLLASYALTPADEIEHSNGSAVEPKVDDFGEIGRLRADLDGGDALATSRRAAAARDTGNIVPTPIENTMSKPASSSACSRVNDRPVTARRTAACPVAARSPQVRARRRHRQPVEPLVTLAELARACTADRAASRASR